MLQLMLHDDDVVRFHSGDSCGAHGMEAHTRTHMADDDGGSGEREESERVDVESRMVFGNWNLKTPKNRRKEIRICPGTHAHTTHNIQTPTSTAKHTQHHLIQQPT